MKRRSAAGPGAAGAGIAGPGVTHGEDTDPDTAPCEEELVGTESSHSPAPDARAEEPAGEVAPSADTEGGIA